MASISEAKQPGAAVKRELLELADQLRLMKLGDEVITNYFTHLDEITFDSSRYNPPISRGLVVVSRHRKLGSEPLHIVRATFDFIDPDISLRLVVSNNDEPDQYDDVFHRDIIEEVREYVAQPDDERLVVRAYTAA